MRVKKCEIFVQCYDTELEIFVRPETLQQNVLQGLVLSIWYIVTLLTGALDTYRYLFMFSNFSKIYFIFLQEIMSLCYKIIVIILIKRDIDKHKE